MAATAEIVIGNKGADFVSLRVRGRISDGWCRADIQVRCDGWAGSISGDFRKGELARFAQEVRRLHRLLHGTARLEPVEPNIVLTLLGDGKGHITVDGVATNHFEAGTRLAFEFTIDQTYLEAIADALTEADPQ